MPNVKQVDFDLNAINNELTGEDTDLHREIMPNLIQQNPYVFKIIKQPLDKRRPTRSSFKLRVDAVGIGLSYQWQWNYYDERIVWNKAGEEGNNTNTLVIKNKTANTKFRCKITDRFGNILYSEAGS